MTTDPHDLLAQAHDALKRAASFDALSRSGCKMSFLVVPLMTPELAINETGDVTVVSRDTGELRRSASGSPMTLADLVQELRKNPHIDAAWR